MHYSTNISKIKSAIEEHGHAVMNVYNVKQNRTDIPLSLFFIDLKPSETNKDITNRDPKSHQGKIRTAETKANHTTMQ